MKILSQITSLSKNKKVLVQILFDIISIVLVLTFSNIFLSNFFRGLNFFKFLGKET